MTLSQRRTILLHLAAWSALFGAYLPFFLTNHIGQPLLRNGLGLLWLGLLYYGNALILIPGWHERGRRGGYWALATGLWAGSAALRLVLERWWFGAGLATGFPSVGRYVLYVAILHGLVWLVSYFLTVLRTREAAARRAQAIISEQQQAQLQYLRSQINPHFLFNTLNNLYALAMARAPETPDVVLRLAALLRYAIYSTREPLVAVGEEVAQIRQLLWLFQLRYEAPMPVSLVVEGPAVDPRIEPMLLMPLVENCLKHSDVADNPAGYIRLRLRLTGEELVFETQNTRAPAPQPQDDAHGVGLTNIRQRLRLTYGPVRAGLAVSETPATFTARLHLPLTPLTAPHVEDSHPAR